MKRYLFLILVLFIFASCRIETNNELIIGEWICDSIQTSNLTYIPENNPTLFFNNKKRKIISYTEDGQIIVKGHNSKNSFRLNKDNIQIEQKNFDNILSKKIIQLDRNSMILEENAVVFNNIVYRGEVAGDNKIRLFYKRKNE